MTDLKVKYKKETGKDWLVTGEGMSMVVSEEYVEWLEKNISSLALYLAQQAVKAYQQESLTGSWLGESMACENILSRIKQLTEVE